MKRVYYDRDKLLKAQDQLMGMDPVDLAESFNSLKDEDLAIAIKLLSKDKLADTFALLRAEKKYALIEMLAEDHIIALIEELDEDELVDTLQELPANMARKVMAYIDEGRRPVVNKILGYPDQSIGAIMSVNFISAKLSSPVSQVLARVKESDLDGNKLEQVWITDQTLRLKGFV